MTKPVFFNSNMFTLASPRILACSLTFTHKDSTMEMSFNTALETTKYDIVTSHLRFEVFKEVATEKLDIGYYLYLLIYSGKLLFRIDSSFLPTTPHPLWFEDTTCSVPMKISKKFIPDFFLMRFSILQKLELATFTLPDPSAEDIIKKLKIYLTNMFGEYPCTINFYYIYLFFLFHVASTHENCKKKKKIDCDFNCAILMPKIKIRTVQILEFLVSTPQGSNFFRLFSICHNKQYLLYFDVCVYSMRPRLLIIIIESCCN
jgi:hypothetical protein